MPYFSERKAKLSSWAHGANQRSSALKSSNYNRLSESDSKNVSKIIEIATIAFHLIALGLIGAVGIASMYTNIGFLFAAAMSSCCLLVAGIIMPLALIINDPERDNTFSRFFAKHYIATLILDIGTTIVATIFSFAVFYNASLPLGPTQLLPLEWVLLVTGGSMVSAGIAVCAATAAGYGLYRCANYAMSKKCNISKKSKVADSLEPGIEMREIARPSDGVPHQTTVQHTVSFSRQAERLSTPDDLDPIPVGQATDDASAGRGPERR